MINKSVPSAKKQKEIYRTSISLPDSLRKAALKKASSERRAFSTYIQILIERDLGKAA